MTSEASAIIRFSAIREQFVETLPAVIAALQRNCHHLADPKLDAQLRREALQTATLEARRIAGSGTTFGFPLLTEKAQRLEALLRSGPDLVPHWKTELFRMLSDLESVALSSGQPEPPSAASVHLSMPVPSSRQHGPPSLLDRRQGSQRQPTLGIAVDRADVRRALEAALAPYDYEVVVAAEAGPVPAGRSIAVWLAELPRVEGLFRRTAAPIVAVIDEDDFNIRLRASRLGCRGVVHVNWDPLLLARAVDRHLPAECSRRTRILIACAEVPLSRIVALILEGAGHLVAQVGAPGDLIDAVAESQPDLVVLDETFAGLSASEVIGVLRQDERMAGVPIVVLSAAQAASGAAQALASGADDLATVPLDPQGLLRTVARRLAQSRQARGLLDRDLVTGLLGDTAIAHHLDSCLAAAERAGAPLTLGLVDLDHFGVLNASHGHAAGDRVLRALSTLLERRAHRSWTLGRVGADELALIMPGVQLDGAHRILDELRVAFATLVHPVSGVAVKATFSGGLAEIGQFSGPDELLKAARAALAAAKRLGHDRVVRYSAAIVPPRDDDEV